MRDRDRLLPELVSISDGLGGDGLIDTKNLLVAYREIVVPVWFGCVLAHVWTLPRETCMPEPMQGLLLSW
jgi:hypothetical protein